MEDITIRAIKTLFSVDIIACEDARRTGLLLQELKKRFLSVIPADAGIQSRNGLDPGFRLDDKGQQLIPFDDHQELSQTPVLIQKLEDGKSVALVSDAGTPLISDPGYKLVNEALKRGITVVSIPGPTAAIAALTSSGLPTNNFLFLGYPPEKQNARINLFRSMLLCFKTLKHTPTVILYCAPHKLVQTLGDMKETFGDIEIVIARELTKVHEEVWRGKLSEALNHFSKPQGEFVFLLHIP